MEPENVNPVPQPVGVDLVAPVVLGDEREELGDRLDALFSMNGWTGRPSDWLRGAVFASQSKLRSNTDWEAQATHSLREILFKLRKTRKNGSDDVLRSILQKYGSAQDLDISISQMWAMWHKLCDVAHHGKRLDEIPEGTFEDLLSSFEKVMRAALERQLDVHAEVDEFFTTPPSS